LVFNPPPPPPPAPHTPNHCVHCQVEKGFYAYA